MRRTLTLLVLPAMFATLALAESWSGTLLDASCYDRQAQQAPAKSPSDISQTAAEACAPTSQTSQFALEANGKMFKLDSAGNSKAATAMKSHAERSTGAPGKASAKVMATVEGTESGGTIKADRIEIQ
ncbi:MAG: hypothetical protein JO307_15420 [Bryobacterales bacterium]|nr:hypothetical protein [Bryobacterales bacterium]MBV9396617.1 hypothetical protein [Bryobacterales bacterium]